MYIGDGVYSNNTGTSAAVAVYDYDDDECI